MLDQMYYSVRFRLEWRLAALAVVILGNILMLLLMRGADATSWQAALAMVFASCALTGIFVINIIVTAANFNEIFKAPKSYLTVLTPIPTWKIILGRIIPSVFIDIISFSIALLFIILMGTHISSDMSVGDIGNMSGHTVYVIYLFVMAAAYYGLFITIGVFWEAVTRSVLHNIPMRKFIGGVVTLLVLLVLSWSNMLLAPLGEVNNFGLLFNVEIYNAQPWHMIPLALLVFAQTAALFVAAVKLINRSFNT